MIINRRTNTCEMTTEDMVDILSIQDPLEKALVRSMVEDIRQDMERWVKEYKITKKEKIDADEYFYMAWEMFEQHWYTQIQNDVTKIIKRTRIE